MKRLAWVLALVLICRSAAVGAADLDSSGGTTALRGCRRRRRVKSSSLRPASQPQRAAEVPPLPCRLPPSPPLHLAPNNVQPVFRLPPDTGYAVESSLVGPLIDIPATLTVLPPALLEDQQVIRFDDLLRNVPSAVKAGDDQWPDAFILRGYFVNPQDFRKDGFVDPTITPRNFANVDHVEILQGPDALLYGPSQPLGTVNLVTKQPVDAWIEQGSVQGGSFGLQHYMIDFNRPLFDDSTSAVRVNAAYMQDDGFRTFGYDQNMMVAPAVTVGAGPRHDDHLGRRVRQRPPALGHRRSGRQRPVDPARQPLPGRADQLPALSGLSRVARPAAPHRRRLVLERGRLFAVLQYRRHGHDPHRRRARLARLVLSQQARHRAIEPAVSIRDDQPGGNRRNRPHRRTIWSSATKKAGTLTSSSGSRARRQALLR